MNLREYPKIETSRGRVKRWIPGPGTIIVEFSVLTQLYDATYFTFSIGTVSGAVGCAGARIVSILDVSKPSLMLAP